MTPDRPARLRQATSDDAAGLVALWQRMFDEMGAPTSTAWQGHARAWCARYAGGALAARIPVIETAGEIVASAVATLEIGVPNPHAPTGRAARLANVTTMPAHRGRGYATDLIRDVVSWARDVGADRVDLSATPDGQRLYERLGFTVTSAPRMKLVL